MAHNRNNTLIHDNDNEFSLDSLKIKLNAIKKRGFIPSMRKGNTGIGYTLEELLEIKENNFAVADYGAFELKALRSDTSTPITLFTLSPKLIRHKNWAEFISEFGYKDSEGRKALKITLKFLEPNEQNFFYSITEENELYIHYKNEKVAKFPTSDLHSKINEKLNQLVYVVADRKKKGSNEEFFYNQAFLLQNPSIKSFFSCLANNYIIIEFRMHIKENGTVRDHGTAFRSKEGNLRHFYENSTLIL